MENMDLLYSDYGLEQPQYIIDQDMINIIRRSLKSIGFFGDLLSFPYTNFYYINSSLVLEFHKNFYMFINLIEGNNDDMEKKLKVYFHTDTNITKIKNLDTYPFIINVVYQKFSYTKTINNMTVVELLNDNYSRVYNYLNFTKIQKDKDNFFLINYLKGYFKETIDNVNIFEFNINHHVEYNFIRHSTSGYTIKYLPHKDAENYYYRYFIKGKEITDNFYKWASERQDLNYEKDFYGNFIDENTRTIFKLTFV